ncbi:phosphoribosyltransferase-like protein [Ereboglobus luteus]|uniref:phosphoribosyltransferase-like protein n=1 Tax=Ereboglobus luteus TaxID=1796921 RepID=UPI0012600FC7|nr:hypothetical protein [Ereboglobus luteus]
MGWNFEEDNQETRWLRMMAGFKYDSYRDFWAGARFVESLLKWLQQFDPDDRRKAYDLIRHKLIFLSFTEIEHLVRRTRPVYVHNVLLNRVSLKTSIPKYLVWAKPETKKYYDDTLARTLFIGLSDGARIDGFRRASAGIISNEQVVFNYELSDDKWKDTLSELRKRTGDSEAKFEVLFLIDDFTASGKSLLRCEESEWKGKLTKFAVRFREKNEMFSDSCSIAVHHYIGTTKAKENIERLLKEASTPKGPPKWFPTPVVTTYDLLLNLDVSLTRTQDRELDALLDKYYDPAIITKSLEVGGTDVKFGFANCGLPLILEHNTPNNSIGLLWAETPQTSVSSNRKMHALFRRRQRHF